MKIENLYFVLFIGFIVFASSCKKDNTGVNSGEFTIEVESGRCVNTLVSAAAYEAGTPLDEFNYVKLTINVTKLGDYSISLDEVNGYTFSETGTFTSLGVQELRLTGSGTPLHSGVDTFTVNFGEASCSFSITVGSDQTNKILITAGYDWEETNYFALALDGSGNKLWTSPGDYNDAAVNDGILYMDRNGKLTAFNIETGEVLWTSNSSKSIKSVTLSDNVIYSQTGDNSLYALSTTDGSVIWEYINANQIIKATPTVYNNVVYTGGDEVYAINTDGSFKWSTNYNSNYFSAFPAVANNIVFARNDNGMFYALDANTGSQIWVYDLGYTIGGSPTTYDGKVYIGGDKLYCIDAAGGNIIWENDVVTGIKNPIIEAGIIYIPGSGGLLALNASSGEVIWEVSLSYSTGTITYSDGFLFYDGVTAKYAEDGSPFWGYGGFTPETYFASVMHIVVYDKVTKEVYYPVNSGCRQ